MLLEGTMVRWDLESVNTCPENYQWNASSVQVEAPGLYEVTLAFFSKKKKPRVQVLANGEVVLQTCLPPTKHACDECGSQPEQKWGPGVVQTLPNGLLKVTAIEFVALQAKSVVTVAFLTKNAHKALATVASPKMSAEGFLGLRKL